MKNITISDELYVRIETYCKRNEKRIDKVVHDAIMWYLNEEENPVDSSSKRNTRIR